MFLFSLNVYSMKYLQLLFVVESGLHNPSPITVVWAIKILIIKPKIFLTIWLLCTEHCLARPARQGHQHVLYEAQRMVSFLSVYLSKSLFTKHYYWWHCISFSVPIFFLFKTFEIRSDVRKLQMGMWPSDANHVKAVSHMNVLRFRTYLLT